MINKETLTTHEVFTGTGINGEVNWESAGFVDGGAEVLALELLGGFQGMTVSQVRQVLRCAENFLDATTFVDATKIGRVCAVYRRVADKSL